jgi:predicted sugar kinase
VVANASYASLSNYSNPLSEKPYTSGSVFNFFPPNYVIPGSSTNAPEFSQENTASAILRLSLANSLVYNAISGFTVDLSATSALGITASKTGNAVTDSGNLVDSLGMIFTHGQMPTQMRTDIVNHVSTLTNIPERVRVATYLVITSSFYKVMH